MLFKFKSKKNQSEAIEDNENISTEISHSLIDSSLSVSALKLSPNSVSLIDDMISKARANSPYEEDDDSEWASDEEADLLDYFESDEEWETQSSPEPEDIVMGDPIAYAMKFGINPLAEHMPFSCGADIAPVGEDASFASKLAFLNDVYGS